MTQTQSMLDSLNLNLLKKTYPELNEEELANILNIKQVTRNLYEKEGFNSFEDWMDRGDPSLNRQYYKIAGKEGNILRVLKDLGAAFNPGMSDTIDYYIDPDRFKEFDIGDYIEGLQMFNVLYGGRKVEPR